MNEKQVEENERTTKTTTNPTKYRVRCSAKIAKLPCTIFAIQSVTETRVKKAASWRPTEKKSTSLYIR